MTAGGAATRLKRKVRRVAKRTPVLRGMLRRYDAARKPTRDARAEPVEAPGPSTGSGHGGPVPKPAKSAGKPVDFGDLVAVLAGARWLGPARYELTGWVYGSKLATTLNPPLLRIWLAGPDGQTIAAEVEQRTDLRANTTAPDGKHDRSGAGFRAVADLTQVLTGPTAELQVLCSLTRPQSRIKGPFTKRIPLGSAGNLAPSDLTDTESTDSEQGGRYLQPAWNDDGGLTITRRDGKPPVTKPAPIMITDWTAIDPGSPRVIATGVLADGIDAGDLRFELRGPQGSVTAVVDWRGPLRQTQDEPSTRSGIEFGLDLPLQAGFWGGPVRPLAQGTYRLWAGTDTESITVRLAPERIARLPESFESSRLNVELGRVAADVPGIHVQPPLRVDEAGPYAFEQQQRRYRTAASTLDRSVYFESFYARSANDSPRAIHEELVRRGSDRTLYWTVADYSVQLPEGATPLLWKSREWWEVLSKSSYFVFNCGAPIPLRKHKRPGQVAVQTWHGTPLKLLGNDRPVNRDRPNYKKVQVGLSSDWDYLLAQNPYAAEIFRDAYFYDGELLELGYPRNDDLVNTSPDEVARLRAVLGIPADKKVILYAPTWRDGEGHIVGYLDLEWLGRQLGDDYFFLLRGHTNSLRPGARVFGSNIIDATSYPLLNDLLLVADIVITDYSSIMFDYTVTGKPIQFFVPDYDDYRDRRRGLYFDLAASAPGPVLYNREDLVESLRDADRLHTEHTKAYAEWVAKFNPRDDGKAAARVVDRIFGEV